MRQPESRFVDIDGPVHYVDHGGDGPPVVCVHGLGGDHLNWFAVGHGLARHGRTLALDLRGHGLTPRFAGSAAVDDNQKLVGRFVEKVIGEPAVLVGNSMGGCISILQGGREPDSVAGLVLVAPAVPGPLTAQGAAILLAVHVPGLVETLLAARDRVRSPEQTLQDLLDLACVEPDRVPDELIAAELELARIRQDVPDRRGAFVQATRTLFRTLVRRKRFDRITRQVTAPTLVVYGDGDRLVAANAIDRLQETRPDWPVHRWPDVGHIPQMEVPGRFLDVVGPWLDGTIGAAPASVPPARERPAAG